MLCSRFIKVLLTILVMAALTTSCININVPGSGNKTPAESGETATPAGTGATVTDPPTIESFAASPENLLSGRSGTLSWSVKNADTIMITPDIGKVDASGSRTVKPANETTYTLVASNSAGMTARPVTIKIMTVSSLEIGASEFQKAGGGTQTNPQGADKYIVGTLDANLQVIKPDIKVLESKLEHSQNNWNISYRITNSGTASSTPFDVSLKIDDVVKSTDHMSSSIKPGDILGGRAFMYKLTPEPNPSTLHKFEIVSDIFNTNEELDENNNSLIFVIPYH